MKKAVWIVLGLVFVLVGCSKQENSSSSSQKEENIVVVGKVMEVNSQSFLLDTEQGEKYQIELSEETKQGFALESGQTVKVEILPEVRESSPVQATGVTIELVAEKKPEYKKITPQQALERMTEEVIVLDVRTQEEFDQGHISNSVLLPDTEVGEKAAEILPDKNQEILIYCRSGRRSALAAKELLDLGYTQVYDFGGILDWPGEVVSE